MRFHQHLLGLVAVTSLAQGLHIGRRDENDLPQPPAPGNAAPPPPPVTGQAAAPPPPVPGRGPDGDRDDDDDDDRPRPPVPANVNNNDVPPPPPREDRDGDGDLDGPPPRADHDGDGDLDGPPPRVDKDGDGDLDGPDDNGAIGNNRNTAQPAQAGTAATGQGAGTNSVNHGNSPGIQAADVDDTPDGDGPDGDGDEPDGNGLRNAAGEKSIPLLATFAMVVAASLAVM